MDDTRTPSGWHDDARTRDAGHDEMQAAYFRFWWSDAAPSLTRPRRYGSGTRPYFFRAAEVEFPFTGYHGRLSGFADIALRFETEETEDEAEKRKQWENNNRRPEAYKPDVLLVFVELKPHIGSIGAVIRQCKATSILAKQKLGSERFEVWAVVYEDDVKAQLLEELSSFPVIRIRRAAP
jgi:hypothetical protein